MRALLFPSYRGSGFGHIGRCLALAEELTRRGNEVAFVLGPPHADRVSAAGWHVFRPPMQTMKAASLPRHWLNKLRNCLTPVQTHLFFSDLNFQVVRDGFHSPQIVEQEVAWELGAVERFQPDVLIGDVWMLTSIVGRLAGLPVVQIIRAAAHPAFPCLVWWREIPPQVCSPDVRPVFNPVLARWGLPPIQRAEDLLDGDLLLVPGIPELDPLPSDVERTRYVGPLIRSSRAEEELPECLEVLSNGDHDRPIIYVTVGGGSEAVRRLNLLPFWEAAFCETDWEVIVSTGGRPLPRRWQPREHFHAFPWVPGPAVIASSDVVLFHGGYGTMMETVRAGVPSVVLPFHTEQEGNGRRLEQSGSARVLAPDIADLHPLVGRWQGKTFVALAGHRWFVHPKQVREAVKAILDNDRYRSNAGRLRSAQAEYAGAPLAADILLGWLSSPH